MNILLTNDDGIHAPGLEALRQAVSTLGETTVVAPDRHLSGCSHQVSHDKPLQAVHCEDGRCHVDGTPADCVRLGLLHLAPETDWVMAGINNGGNLGVDVHMSGTVAAVREAVFFGKPAIAFSQYRRKREELPVTDGLWTAAQGLVRQVLDVLLSQPPEPGSFWNVNFPDFDGTQKTSEIVFCPLEPTHLPVRYEFRDGRYHDCTAYHERSRQQGSDVDVCFSGRIAVTQVRLWEPDL